MDGLLVTYEDFSIIDLEELEHYIQDQSNQFQIYQGMTLSKKQQVTIREQLIGHSRLTATVKDERSLHLFIDLDQPKRSSCECTRNFGICEHLIAVFFAMINEFESPDKTYYRLLSKPVNLSSTQESSARKMQSNFSFPKPDDDPKTIWHNYFKTSAEKLTRSMPAMYKHTLFDHLRQQFKRSISNWQEDQRILFLVEWMWFLCVHLPITRVRQPWETNSKGYEQSEFEKTIHTTIVEIWPTISLYPKHLEYIQLMIFQHIVSSPENSGWHCFAIPFWNQRLRSSLDANTFYQTLIRIREQIPNDPTNTITMTHLDAFRCRLLFLLSRDQELFELRKLQPEIMSLEEILSIIYTTLLKEMQFSRIMQWLEYIKGELAHLRYTNINYQVMVVLRNVPTSVASIAHKTDYLFELGKPFYPQYQDWLWETEQFTRWVDAKLYDELAELTLSSSDQKMLEKHHPIGALAIATRHVDQLISLRSRDFYKIAVRKMKWIRSMYAKMKQEDRWERYIGIVKKRNSRLRSLIEEMQKGKVI